MKRWLISNMDVGIRLESSLRRGGFELQWQGGLARKSAESGLFVGIDGFVMPRSLCYDGYRHLEGLELVERLYEEKGAGFIDHVKGVFTILVADGRGFHLYNDRHSIRKFFLYRNGDRFLIASDLADIASEVGLEADAERAALFCLMTHFVAGTTLFHGVEASGPATAVHFDDTLRVENFWLPDALLNMDARNTSIAELADFWRQNVGRYVEYLNPSALTMTLTGGMDSRMILAALLSLGIRPNAFTFGDPRSLDAVTAGKVAASQNLNYHCHNVREPSADWFERRGREIIAIGGSLLNIHRALRLEAIEREMECHPGNEMILVGDMGGEYIQGVAYHDYIISKLFRLWQPGDENGNKELIRTILAERHFKAAAADLDEVLSILAGQPFMRHKGKNGHFHVEFYVDAALHHTQDVNLYLNKLPFVVCPFMDIDWLEAVFSSPFHMPLGDYVPDRGHVLENWRPNLRLGVTHLLAPQLSGIEYGKRGYYSAIEFLGSKPLLFAKRSYRYAFRRNTTPSFPYGAWIVEFARRSCDGLSSATRRLADLERYRHGLARPVHGREEGYWHDFTNLINIDYIIKEYVK